MFRPPLLRGRIENCVIFVSPRLLPLGRFCRRIHCACPRFVYARRPRRRGSLRRHRRLRFESSHCGSQTLRRGPLVRRVRAHAFFRRAFIFEAKLWTGLQQRVRGPAWIGRFRHGHGFGHAGRMGIRRARPFRSGPDASLSASLAVHLEDDVSTLNTILLDKEFLT